MSELLLTRGILEGDLWYSIEIRDFTSNPLGKRSGRKTKRTFPSATKGWGGVKEWYDDIAQRM